MKQGRRRVLIYSHDSFGLGHLRRCRAIAHALAEHDPDLSVLILSGSPIIGSFTFHPNVDFVRVPGVIKLRDGGYSSLSLRIDITQTLAIRGSIIRHTAAIFDPDLFIVDKEPLGLRGEVEETLKLLKDRGTPLVLGLRDVMDEPAILAPEWERKHVVPALEKLYDEIWVYGLYDFCDPLEGIELSPVIRRKMIYTGYLGRHVPAGAPLNNDIPSYPYILVTPGGGGDGENLVDWVLRAYETDPDLPHRALIVLGPFMAKERQMEFLARAAALPAIEAITFEARLEALMQSALGVVAMGGYNTFCEILSFNKRALLVPRTVPRLEQFIRASRAQELGLVRMLADDGERRAGAMVAALRALPEQSLPLSTAIPGLLDGLPTVNRLMDRAHFRSRPSLTPAPVRGLQA